MGKLVLFSHQAPYIFIHFIGLDKIYSATPKPVSCEEVKIVIIYFLADTNSILYSTERT